MAIRTVASAFYHGDMIHLAYNMSSLLWKGGHLERTMGGPRFAALTAMFVVLTGFIAVVVSLSLSLSSSCAIGFSGVLFA